MIREEDPENHDLAIQTMTGIAAREAGDFFLNKETHTFTPKNRAKFTIYASLYTPAFDDWAFAHQPNEDRFNGPAHTAKGVISIATNPIPVGVDIAMMHCFGHIHEGYGIEVVDCNKTSVDAPTARKNEAVDQFCGAGDDQLMRL